MEERILEIMMLMMDQSKRVSKKRKRMRNKRKMYRKLMNNKMKNKIEDLTSKKKLMINRIHKLKQQQNLNKKQAIHKINNPVLLNLKTNQ